MSDIIGIINEERAKNANFTRQAILDAYLDMYGDTDIDLTAKNT